MAVIGCLIGSSTTATLCVLPFFAFGFALYATSSQLANAVATQSVCVIVVLSGLRLAPENAFGDGGLVLAGGVAEILLLTVLWPVNPRFPERKAVADAYFSLSTFFDRIPTGVDQLIPASQRFEDARGVIQEAMNMRWRTEHDLLVELMRAGETLRAASVGFAQSCEHISESACQEAAVLCRQLSLSLRAASGKILTGKFEELSGVAGNLPSEDIPELAQAPELRHWYVILKGQLSDLQHTKPHIMDEPMKPPNEATGWRKAFSFLTKLPDAASMRKIALQHALRYTIALEFALAISRWVPEGHFYWLPLTVAIILRPDFASTVTRGVARLLGTLAGVVIAGVIMAAFHPSREVLSVFSFASTWFCFALFQPNYALYSAAITLYVVFSVGSAGLSIHHATTGVIRFAATLLGSGICVAAYVIWPSFQGRQLRQVIADALDAQVAFGKKVKEWTGGPLEEVEDARNHARQLRLRSESAFQTAALEPWGVSPDELQMSRNAIIRLDENAAELLAFRVDQEADPAEIDRVLASSTSVRNQILSE
jgi:uncharacterized membrane protein YccC